MADAAATEFDRKLLIEGLGKGLRVIEAFSDEHPRMTATETGALAGLTRTAARRYLMSLVHFGYAETDGKYYWLTPRVLRLGQSYLAGARLPRLIQPFVQRLSMSTGETANVSVLDGHEVVYIVRSNSPRIISIGFQAGARVPAHVVSPGPAILSTYSDARLDAWIAEHDFARFTAHTVTEPEAFRASVRAARQLGYGSVEQNINLHLCGLAVALTDRRGKCVAALSMTVPTQAYPEHSHIAKLLPALQEAAQLLRNIV